MKKRMTLAIAVVALLALTVSIGYAGEFATATASTSGGTASMCKGFAATTSGAGAVAIAGKGCGVTGAGVVTAGGSQTETFGHAMGGSNYTATGNAGAFSAGQFRGGY